MGLFEFAYSFFCLIDSAGVFCNFAPYYYYRPHYNYFRPYRNQKNHANDKSIVLILELDKCLYFVVCANERLPKYFWSYFEHARRHDKSKKIKKSVFTER